MPDVINLCSSEFEMAFQVVYQLADYDPIRLAGLGFPLDEVEPLIEVLTLIRRQVGEGSSIDVRSDESRQKLSSLCQLVVDVRDTATVKVSTRLPCIAVKFPEMMCFIVSSLGERELFLRTGYYVREVELMAHKLMSAKEGCR